MALAAPLAGSASAASAGCVSGPAGVPAKAFTVAEYARSHNGATQPAERVVLGPAKAASYYTPDHYSTFITLYGDSCPG